MSRSNTSAFDIADGMVRALHVVRNPEKLRYLPPPRPFTAAP